MGAKTRHVITTKALKEKQPLHFSDIYVLGMILERLNFICDLLSFTYSQGSAEQCINLIKQNNKKTSQASSPPLIVCSTDRHIAQNTFSNYYRIWTLLTYVFGETSTKKSNKEAEE
jgi:hypothetical protein